MGLFALSRKSYKLLRLIAFDGYGKLDEFYTSGVGIEQFVLCIYCHEDFVF